MNLAGAIRAMHLMQEAMVSLTRTARATRCRLRLNRMAWTFIADPPRWEWPIFRQTIWDWERDGA